MNLYIADLRQVMLYIADLYTNCCSVAMDI